MSLTALKREKYAQRRGVNSDRLKGSLEAFVRIVLTRIDALAWYPAKVVTQHADQTLDVKPDEKRLPSMSHVPLRYALPGLSVKVQGGARVLVGFEGGDLRHPIATLWEGEGLQEIAFDGGTQPVARVGDTVSLSIPPGTSLTGLLSGQPFTGTFMAPVQLTGTILTGNTKVRA